MAETYESERLGAKADIEAAGCPCKIVDADDMTLAETAMLIIDFTFTERLGGAVLDGDLKTMIPHQSFTLNGEVHDVVVDTNDELFAAAVGRYQIVNPAPFMPSGVPIFYNAQLRKR